MDQSFNSWENSEDQLVSDSVVISDSDEDVENSFTAANNSAVVESYDEDTDSGISKQVFEKRSKRVVQRKINIVESDETADDSQEEYHTICHLHNSDSDKENFADSISYSPIENNDSKKKNIHNSTKEEIKGLKHNYSNKSLLNNSHKQNDKIIQEISDYKISDHEISDYERTDHEVQKKETFHDISTIVHDTDSSSERHSESEIEIEKLEKTPLSLNIQENEVSKESHLTKKESLPIKDEPYSDHSDYSYLDINNIPMKPTTSPELRQLGEKAQATRDRELALTVERLQDLHGSLVARPRENEKAKDPRGLKVQLMPHQQHALAWLLWREQQRPAGGVLADDMGLGKTLTMISLIMTTLTQKNSLDESDDSDDDEWNNDHKQLYHKGGTLVICPASLLFQWDNEVQNRCKRGLLTVEMYHGSNRESVPKRLSKNDIVITTYNILSREHKTRSTLYKINWKRVILDEAHVIRNHKSQASLAVCELKANKRWALTGTPIQNKAMDLYSILKFLKCSPFDDLRVWKRWVDNKNAAGNQRLMTVMKSLMLRRTKQELIEKGDLESLPDKFIEELIVKLDPQEQLVYEKVLIYSRTLFAQFLVQKAEKEHMSNLCSGNDGLARLSNPNIPFSKAQNELMAMYADVKSHQIFVLILRLRQLCCHPPLIHAMLDQDDIRHNEIRDTENVNPDLLSQMNNMSLNERSLNEMSLIDKEEKKEVDIDGRIIENLLTAENPIFHDDRISSKMRTLLNMVKEILQKSEDKLIIVSQWTALLNVIASHLSSIKGATFRKFTGNVAIKDRQSVIDSFNNRNSDPRILLLSLTAGGVGLNLVGANHLLLFDIHWNPQLETQAQDRIYRFGQKKDVHVYRFICHNTIEERIKVLQDRKLEIASNVLNGDKNNDATKLTLNDLKTLFEF